MKKYLQLFVIVALVLAQFHVTPAFATTTCTHDVFKCELIENGTAISLKGFVNNPTSTTLTIPSTLTVTTDTVEKTLPVIEIGDASFNNSELTDVTFPQTLQKIGMYAFSTNKLKELVIPSSVFEIRDYAFIENALDRVTFEGSGQLKLFPHSFADQQKDGQFFSGWFTDASYTTPVDLTAPITKVNQTVQAGWPTSNVSGDFEVLQVGGTMTITNYIGTSANVVIPATLNGLDVTAIGPRAFKWKNLEEVTIPNTVTSIGEEAFQDNKLQRVTLPEANVVFGASAFAYNELKELILPEGITQTGQDTFRGNQLTSVKFPSTLLSIGDRSFSNNPLETLDIPTGVTQIGSYAFSDNQLKNLQIPATVTRISMAAFSRNPIDTVTFLGTPELEQDVFHDLIKEGHAFDKWYKDSGKTTEWQANTPQQVSASTFYTDWSILNFTLTFETDGGTMTINGVPTTEQVVEYNQLAIAPDISKTGYVFAGWYKEAALINEWGLATDQVVENTTLYAKWNLAQYAVQFNSNGGSAVAGVSVKHENLMTEPSSPTRAGYVFAGWYKEAALTNEWDFATDQVVETTTLYAKWEVAQYTVQFNSNGGSPVADVPAKHENMMTEPSSPTKAGYVFAGWYKEAALTNEWDFATDQVVENTTLYAKWNVAQYTVQFNSNGGSAVADVPAAHETIIVAPQQPTKAGFIFAGWYKDAAYTNEWAFTTDKVVANTTLYAKWQVRQTSGGRDRDRDDSDDVTEITPAPGVTPVQPQPQPTETEQPAIEPAPLPEVVEPLPVTFVDIQTHPAKEIMEWFAEQGYVIGYSDGTIRPDEPMKRSQVATVLTRMFDFERSTTLVPFKDIARDHPAYTQIMILQQAGIFSGTNGNFNEQAPITQAQFAKIIVKLFGLTPDGEVAFLDMSTQHWSYPYAATLVELGIMDAPNQQFEPNKAMTRAQFIVLLKRAIDTFEK